MDINQLRYFIEICKLGSMSKAAVSLNISPQGISAAIRRLEDELMADLFYRSANGLELTNLGKSSVFRGADNRRARGQDL